MRPLRVELLYFEGCPGHEAVERHVREVLAGSSVPAVLELREVDTVEAAEAERFLGSPTVRVEGEDIDPGARDRTDYGIKCRLYRSAAGSSGTPSPEWLPRALARTAAAGGRGPENDFGRRKGARSTSSD